MSTNELVVQEDVEEESEGRQVMVLDGATALATVNRAEIDMQITTAKQYPRNITDVKRQALALATLDEETSTSMYYSLPRGGKRLQGMSIRMAEVIGSCWGNLRYGASVVAIDPPGRKGTSQFVTARGMCHDLEKNVCIAWETKRRITNKDGIRFNEDMIQVTGAAACAIALREAIFKVVPRALVKPIYDAAVQASLGKGETMMSKRTKMLEYFNKMGVDQDKILAAIEVKGVDDIGIDELIFLKGLATAIKDGETTVDEAFSPKLPEGRKIGRSELNDEPKEEAKPAGDTTKTAKTKRATKPAEQKPAENSDGLAPGEKVDAKGEITGGETKPEAEPTRPTESAVDLSKLQIGDITLNLGPALTAKLGQLGITSMPLSTAWQKLTIPDEGGIKGLTKDEQEKIYKELERLRTEGS